MVKGVLHAQGLIPTPAVRLPLLPAAEANIDTAVQSLYGMETSSVREPAGPQDPDGAGAGAGSRG